jgi:hypothetical protein
MTDGGVCMFLGIPRKEEHYIFSMVKEATNVGLIFAEIHVEEDIVVYASN